MIKAGIFASSSSKVVVPNLSGMTPSQAIAALSTAELLVGTTSSTSSGATSSNNGLVASQTVAAGTLVERYSSVGYTIYSYSTPPPTSPPPTCDPAGTITYSATTWSGECSDYCGNPSPCYYEIGTRTKYVADGACGYSSIETETLTRECSPYAPPPTTTTPPPAVVCGSAYGTTLGAVYPGACPDGSCPGCSNYQEYWYKCSDGTTNYSVKYYQGLGCSTPTTTTTTTTTTPPVSTTPPPSPCTPSSQDISGIGCCDYVVNADCTYYFSGSCC